MAKKAEIFLRCQDDTIENGRGEQSKYLPFALEARYEEEQKRKADEAKNDK